MGTFNVGHGLFSLLDEFPFHPTYGDRFVSFPEEQRVFGQGVDATFDDFEVTTTTLGEGVAVAPTRPTGSSRLPAHRASRSETRS
jgi:hypothetical protein